MECLWPLGRLATGCNWPVGFFSHGIPLACGTPCHRMLHQMGIGIGHGESSDAFEFASRCPPPSCGLQLNTAPPAVIRGLSIFGLLWGWSKPGKESREGWRRRMGEGTLSSCWASIVYKGKGEPAHRNHHTAFSASRISSMEEEASDDGDVDESLQSLTSHPAP